MHKKRCIVFLASICAKDANTMIVECHDSAINHPRGTLLGIAGKSGTIHYPYQAEKWVKEFMEGDTSRVYVCAAQRVLAVFAYTAEGPRAVACTEDWRGQWKPSPLVPETRVVSAYYGDEDWMYVYAEAEKWARVALAQADVATAVLFDTHGLLMAWEKDSSGPVLVAKSPRPL